MSFDNPTAYRVLSVSAELSTSDPNLAPVLHLRFGQADMRHARVRLYLDPSASLAKFARLADAVNEIFVDRKEQ